MRNMISRQVLAIVALGASVLVAQPAAAAIPGAATAATRYDVTVNKVELCSDATCSTAVVLGSGDSVFNIASVSAGAQIGSYARTTGLPIGQTFTHLRVTIDSEFVIAGQGNDNGAQVCGTDSTNAASNHTAVGTGIVGGGAGSGTAQTLFIPDVGSQAGNPTLGDYAGFNMVKADGGDAVITYPLTAAYTVQPQPPVVEVIFNTSQALGLVQTGAGTCGVFPRPPDVTITIR